MLSPGDQVFIDGNNDPNYRWTIETVYRDSTGNQYHLKNWPHPTEDIPAKRITGHWVEE